MKLQPHPDVFDGWAGNLADIVLIRVFIPRTAPFKQNQQNNYPTATVCLAIPGAAHSLTFPRKHHTLPV